MYHCTQRMIIAGSRWRPFNREDASGGVDFTLFAVAGLKANTIAREGLKGYDSGSCQPRFRTSQNRYIQPPGYDGKECK